MNLTNKDRVYISSMHNSSVMLADENNVNELHQHPAVF